MKETGKFVALLFFFALNAVAIYILAKYLTIYHVIGAVALSAVVWFADWKLRKRNVKILKQQRKAMKKAEKMQKGASNAPNSTGRLKEHTNYSDYNRDNRNNRF